MIACFDVWLHHANNTPALCIVCTNYSSLGISTGGETEGDPVCSTEEESSLEKEESSEDSGDFPV